MPEISVVIPTHGRRPTLARVLDGLELSAVEPNLVEVVLVADGGEAADRARGAIGDRRHEARLLTSESSGASAARNRGWHAAASPLVLFLDDDTIPTEPLIGEHLGHHRREPAEEVGVLGHVRWARELRVTPFMRWLQRGIQFDYERIVGDEAGWGRLYTANVSLKRSLLERAGGFDAIRFPFGYEDLDLGYRLDQLGLRLLYAPRAEVEHLHPTDLEEWRSLIARVAVAERRFVESHPDVRPYFHDLLGQAREGPRARGRGTRLARFVPPGLPWLGPRVWTAADLYWRQALAEPFFEAWDSARPGGSEPAGPK